MKIRSSWMSLLSVKNIFLAMITGGIWLVVPVIRILSTEYEVTDQQLLITKGMMSKSMDQVDWIRLKDVRMTQGMAGRILNFGDLVLMSSDQSHSQIQIKDVSDPATLRKKILDAANKEKEKRGVRLQEWI